MKKLFFLLMLTATLSTYSQSVGGLIFESKVGNYGEIKQGDTAEVEFVFKNTSQDIIEIKDVKTNTRSISFKIKDKKIQPGQTSTITIVYNSKEVGPIRNTITILTSGESPIYTLAVRGSVVKP